MRILMLTFLFAGITIAEFAIATSKLTLSCEIRYCDPRTTPCTIVKRELNGFEWYAGINPNNPRFWSLASAYNGPLCFGSDPHRFKDLEFLVAPLRQIDPQDGPRDQKPNLSLYVKYWFAYSWYQRLPFSNGNQVGSSVDLTHMFDNFCARPVTQKKFICTLVKPVPDTWGYYR
jgi:hypothetical protein